jgi:hypothetical protein
MSNNTQEMYGHIVAVLSLMFDAEPNNSEHATLWPPAIRHLGY